MCSLLLYFLFFKKNKEVFNFHSTPNAYFFISQYFVKDMHFLILCFGRPACDVAISGLGWISVEPVSKSMRISHPNLEVTSGELHLNVHVPKPVEIFVRPPMPVGKTGAEWYQYPELTEKEEEARPKWHF